MAGRVPVPPGAAVAAEEGVETHPLLNPVVLKTLFELIPFELKEFRNFRLVSRAWNDLSLPKWRQNAWLSLVDSDPKIHEISLQKYTKLIENDKYQLAKHPFRKYVMTMWNVNIQGEQDQLRFWNRVGPLMRSLILQKTNFFGPDDLRAVIFEKTPNLQRLSLLMNFYQCSIKRPDINQRLDPKFAQNALIPTERVQKNLKELDIDLIIRPEEGEERVFNVAAVQINPPITWIELFMHFPNIQKLGPLQLGVGVKAEFELLEFFESIYVLRKEHGPRYLADLQDLDLMPTATLACSARSRLFVISLNRLRFPLKRLSLALALCVDEKLFEKMLQGCVNTLEHLSVVKEGPPFRNFPFGLKFITLKELILARPIAPNLMFLKDCPNLEMLGFTPVVPGSLEADLTQVMRRSDGLPLKLEKMKELWILNDGCSAEEVRKLGQLMPNIRRLRMGLDNRSFRAVCGEWKELEQLTIIPWRIGEEALLGKDQESGENFRHPNLMDLKNLKRFKMEGIEMPRDRQSLTTAAILEGFMALRNLELVKLLLFISGNSGSSRAARQKVSRMLQSNK